MAERAQSAANGLRASVRVTANRIDPVPESQMAYPGGDRAAHWNHRLPPQ
jgi:hypothetical protein